MRFQYLADYAFTRRHTGKLYRYAFPFYGRALRWQFMVVVLFVLLLHMALTGNGVVDWLVPLGLPARFVQDPAAVNVGVLLIGVFVAARAISWARRWTDRQFAAAVPVEAAEVELNDHDLTLNCASAQMRVPLDKITTVVAEGRAVVVGFSGSGLVLSDEMFPSPTDKEAFLRALAAHLSPEALVRSSANVRAMT